MNVDAALNFKNILDWHNWLEQNHNKKTEAWVVIYKKHNRQPGIRYDEALEEALCFGWIDGKMKSVDEERFILRYSPRKPNSVWSKINRDKAEQLITQGRMTTAGLTKIDKAKKNGTWYAAYTNKIRDKIPSDLKRALMENAEAWNNFENFANSYWNMYIGWVSGAKTDETRRKRITEVVKRSALNKRAGIE